MKDIDLYRARQQPSTEDERFPFDQRQEQRPFDRKENYREAAIELQRELEASATRSMMEASDPYLSLPPAIRAVYNKAEYMWLSDDEKSTLLQRECDPEF